MKITNISIQAKNKDRVNVSVDGRYRFSLDVFQVSDLGIKLGKEYSEDELRSLETESEYGKLYMRALEYCLMRPHSAKELRDYLYKKTRTTKLRSKKTGELYDKPGVSQEITSRVYDRLVEKGHIDDEKFAQYWVEHRNLRRGASRRKLTTELRAKGVESAIIESVIGDSSRSDESELQKVISKKKDRYPDEQKLIQYLARQGFSYDDIKQALARDD